MGNGLLSQNIPYTELFVSDMVFAIAVLLAGFIFARILISLFNKGLKKTQLPDLVIEFLSRFLSILLYVLVILAFAGALGFAVGSVFLGLSAVIGLILGFGMQDTLTNLTAGIWIATLRPIDKDDYVTINGMFGKVEAVGMMATEILTPDNQFITIPNQLVWGSAVINDTRMPIRRARVDVGVSYDTDLDKAIQVAFDVMKNNSMVLDDPAPAVITSELGDSSVNLQLRAWANNEDVWTVKWDLTSEIFKAYRKEGIEIPYPQMDVHLDKEG
ncbi:mechanosensitive ion channel family protein [Methanohalobium sp.]|uniref:mechanosensitive ion channel family protein n=1 Tax=Methanohalobium sp. TaxID=2837493 RepID=UPI0025E412AD|nr:mechanosensitive ion channel family protein [Methanohalobium sp.]